MQSIFTYIRTCIHVKYHLTLSTCSHIGTYSSPPKNLAARRVVGSLFIVREMTSARSAASLRLKISRGKHRRLTELLADGAVRWSTQAERERGDLVCGPPHAARSSTGVDADLVLPHPFSPMDRRTHPGLPLTN